MKSGGNIFFPKNDSIIIPPGTVVTNNLYNIAAGSLLMKWYLIYQSIRR